MASINTVYKVYATNEPDVYVLYVNITDGNSETYDCNYVSRPDDPYGLNPMIRAWLAEHLGSIEVVPYRP